MPLLSTWFLFECLAEAVMFLLEQIFRPFVCELRQWDLPDFVRCTAKRRIILIGDMTMQQMFNSLACLLHSAIRSGSQTTWQVGIYISHVYGTPG